MESSSSYSLKSAHELSRPLFKTVAEAMQQRNIPCYLIGGFVRDLLLERPCKDIDFVVLGSGPDAAAIAAAALRAGDVKYFRNFGTAMFRHKDMDIEFVGARKESYQRDSRKPIVENGTLQDDQNRRDFTINALAISLNTDDYGQLIDPFGGISDLESGIIRTPLDPDITFSDDPLRMMRAIRFASQLGFVIEFETFEAIKRNRERISIVSQERITDELNKIILSKRPSSGFRLLFDSGLLELIFPEMHALHGIDTVDGMSHKDNFYHTIKVLDNLAEKTGDLWLRWAAIMHDIAKPPTKRFEPGIGWTFHGHEEKGARMVPGIFKRMRLPLDHKMKFVQKLVQLHLRPIALTRETVTDSAVRRLLFDAGEDLEALMLLCESDITSRNKEKVEKFLRNFKYVRQRVHEVEQRDHVRNWQPPITGEQIIATFGISPSKPVGVLKQRIKDAILDGEIPNTDQAAWKLLYEEAAKMGLKPKENNA
jgi:tRNA nucleotidyltransferase/poly(A) polymerase